MCVIFNFFHQCLTVFRVKDFCPLGKFILKYFTLFDSDFNISCRAGFVMLKSSSFSLSENSLSLDHIWMLALVDRVFLVPGFFLSYFEYIMPNLLVFKVCAKESPVSFMGVSLMYNGCFFLSAFNILFIFNFYSFNYNVSCCGSLWIQLVWDSLSPWIWVFVSFTRLAEVFSY